jgi:two-component system sensor histidine kinase UhpB
LTGMQSWAIRKPLRVLIIEDNENDAILLAIQLKHAGFDLEWERVDTEDNISAALENREWDIIISDYILPSFSGLETLKMLNQKGLDTPCIIVSGKISDETAVNAMRAGARDYITKDNLSRLGPVVERELFEAAVRKEHLKAEELLKETNEFKALLLEHSPMAMLAINPDSSIRYFNKAAEKLTGFLSSELINSKAPYVFWPSEKVAEYLRDIENDSFRHIKTTQKLFCNKNREEFWVDMTTIPIWINGKLEYILTTWINLTEEKRLRKELELFNHKIIQAQEEERKRIARELHEDTVQLLAIIKLEIESLVRSCKGIDEEILRKLEYLKENTDHAMQDIRRFSYALRPGELDYLGLDTTLEQLAEDINEQGELIVDFEIKGKSRRLTSDIELVLFRIAQEAINNIQKHARATKAQIIIEYYPEKVRLAVRDNGKGFSMVKESESAISNGRLGLIGMRERAHLINADLRIESMPDQGTTILVEVNRKVAARR